MRLEVYLADGQKLFDLELKRGNVLDWYLQDGQAERLGEGSYLCAVTAKDLSGKLTQKIGMVAVSSRQVSINPARASELTPQQAQAIGPLEEDSTISVLKDDEPVTTVIAYNGEDAQISRGSGALSFRIGDFFRGKDTEQMRLTPEGNLGIGITNPTAKLDVDGMIRARQGIVFPDGSVQFSASRKTFGAASIKPGQFFQTSTQDQEHLMPDTTGTGTTGKLSRWLDGPAGVLGDSNITETSGAIGINGSPNTSFRLDVNGSTRIRGSNPGFNLEGARAAGNIWLFQTVDNDGRFRLFSQDNINPGQERLTIKLDTGNVGIGTSNPARPLEIATGKMRFSSNLGDIEFTEVADLIAWATTASPSPADPAFRVDVGTGLSQLFTVLNNGNVGIGTTTPFAKLEVRGSIRLGSNGQYLAAGGDESLRIVRGDFNGQGGIITGFGFNVSRTDVGTYTITFNTPFSALPSVTANPYASSFAGFALINASDASSVSLYLCKASSPGTLCDRYDAPISFIVVGPR